jgi:predicted glycogen debranching enzyme
MRYVQESNDVAVWQDWLGQAVCGVLDAYECGTDFAIHMDDDGLIAAGSPDTQLTWMDAARGGVVFTPRYGKAVEINALWYDALVGVAELVSRYDEGERAAHYTSLANRAKRSFRQLFWNKKHQWLNDCVWLDERGHAHVDATLRPNQILAASLPHSPLGESRRKAIVDAVREHLLTPYGLRTLPPNDCNYHGRYEGSMFERDGAYHQGTVWPWLIGPYAEAVLRAGAFSKKARHTAHEAVAPLLKQLCGDGLGQLHEVHDGDPPHHPGGCMAQAWSVAEVLRLLRLITQAWPAQSS